MQISRHWRLNKQRYRLVGFRHENGQVNLQDRPAPVETDAAQPEAKRPQQPPAYAIISA